MTDSGYRDEGEPRHGQSADRQRRPWYQRGPVRALIAAATFVVGLFVGGLIVGFAGAGSTPPVPTRTVTASPTPAPRTPGSPAPATGRVTVNQACLRAINDGQSTYGQIGRILSSLRALNAAQVDNAIRKLQRLQSQMRHDAGSCKIIAHLPQGTPSTSAGVTLSPSPSAS